MPSDSEQTSTGRQGRHFRLRHQVALILVVLTAIFVAQNRSRAPVDVLWVRATAPLWLVLTILFGVGLFVGLLLHRRRR
jgi:lipopolysaccharide assembly protein A